MQKYSAVIIYTETFCNNHTHRNIQQKSYMQKYSAAIKYTQKHSTAIKYTGTCMVIVLKWLTLIAGQNSLDKKAEEAF